MTDALIDQLAEAMRQFAFDNQLSLSPDNVPWSKLPEFRKEMWRKRARHVVQWLEEHK